MYLFLIIPNCFFMYVLFKMIKYFVETYNVDVNTHNKYNESLLIEAIYSWNIEIIKYLIETCHIKVDGYLDDENTCYSCVPYPFGLVSPEEVIQIDAYSDFDIVHTGYKSEAYSQFMEFLDQLQASFEEFGAEEVSKSVSDVLKQIEELNEGK